MEAFKLPFIGTLFCYAKNGIEFFETPVDQLFILNPLNFFRYLLVLYVYFFYYSIIYWVFYLLIHY